MSSNRDLILKAYQKMLSNISEANGFENDVKQVERKMLYYDTISSFPVLMILGGDEKFEDVMGGSTLSRMQIKIRGFTKDEAEPEVALDSMIEDVLSVLENVTYNVYHSLCRVLSISTDEGWISSESGGVSMFEVTVEQLYKFVRGTP
jgi:hypothetical protein